MFERFLLRRSGEESAESARPVEHALQRLRVLERLHPAADLVRVDLEAVDEPLGEHEKVLTDPGDGVLGAVGHLVECSPQAGLARVETVVGCEGLHVGDHERDGGVVAGGEARVVVSEDPMAHEADHRTHLHADECRAELGERAESLAHLLGERLGEVGERLDGVRRPRPSVDRPHVAGAAGGVQRRDGCDAEPGGDGELPVFLRQPGLDRVVRTGDALGDLAAEPPVHRPVRAEELAEPVEEIVAAHAWVVSCSVTDCMEWGQVYR